MNEFDARIRKVLPEGLRSQGINILQVNVGRHCNLACTHCHLECSPGRTEMMPWRIMEHILKLTEQKLFRLVDITGGSPELHQDFRRFLSDLRDRGQTVQVRTNLTVLMEPSLRKIIPFLREKEIQLVGSLPCYLEENVNAQRGANVYQRSIAALRLLNRSGYGIEDKLPLNLVFNPGGAFLPPDQFDLEDIYRHELKERFDISFDRLLVLTNMPLGRFKRYLEANGEMEAYISMLEASFNPSTVDGLMCRHQICIDWDGSIYDCDFNLALGMTVNHSAPGKIENFDRALLDRREITTGIHCFGCTAGAGSSCAGSLIA
ncbi:MAG TPA: arsenosugar biosynthesis radical SAM (seleno)protein ArsS [Syntrophales bacterium]|nr:arsenosugar biosynthesis radical SAM (seleno)protein ArsS [Syntrophales bacterium]